MRHTLPALLLMAAALLLAACGDRTARRCYDRARALTAQGDAPQALAWLRQAADHARSDTLCAAIASDMGHLLFREGLQEEALGAFRQAYEADRRAGDSLNMACDLADMGNVYRTREADDSCLLFFERARQLAESMGDTALADDMGSQMAGYYLWHKRYPEARRLLMPALLRAGADDAGLRFMAANLYHHTGPADSARLYCRSLLDDGETIHRQMAHRWLAEQLLAAWREGAAGKAALDEAAQHLQQYELLTDTLQQETDTEAMRRASALYDYSRRERQAARLQLRLVWVAAAALVLAVGLLAVVLYFSRRRLAYRLKVQRLEQLLADYRQRDTLSAERQQQVLTNTPIYRRITQLLAESQPHPLSDEEWRILSDTIDKIHPQFQRRLFDFQRLSPQEMRISMLVKAGIAPADIARLTARSKQSVSSTRSRLYEKAFGRKGSPAQWDEFIGSL